MSTFKVFGPLEVPVQRNAAARAMTAAEGRAFWQANPDRSQGIGAYVFGVRAGGGMTPTYIGRATKSFGQEVFTPHKLAKYQLCLSHYVRGTPVLFFVELVRGRGRPNVRHIEDLEGFLIRTGVAANPDILNERGVQEEGWNIDGVLRAGRGRPGTEAVLFRSMMGL